MKTIDQILKIKEGLKAYVVTEQEERSGRALFARRGSLLVSVRTEGDGKLHVAAWVDYGQDGKTWVDGRTYKTPAGVVKFATQHLK